MLEYRPLFWVCCHPPVEVLYHSPSETEKGQSLRHKRILIWSTETKKISQNLYTVIVRVPRKISRDFFPSKYMHVYTCKCTTSAFMSSSLFEKPINVSKHNFIYMKYNWIPYGSFSFLGSTQLCWRMQDRKYYLYQWQCQGHEWQGHML